jgi:two-component system response regulator RegA
MSKPPEILSSVLIVDDDAGFRSTLARAFERRGWDCREASNFEEALALARIDSPEHAVVDLKLGEANGVQLVRELLLIDPATRIVLFTGFGSIATAIEAMRAGAVHYLTKPADVNDLIAALGGGPATADAPIVIPSLDRVEWEHIQRVLVTCGGNVSQAAKHLGIHRRSLQRKLARSPRSR